jgi:hypothetical protein
MFVWSTKILDKTRTRIIIKQEIFANWKVVIIPIHCNWPIFPFLECRSVNESTFREMQIEVKEQFEKHDFSIPLNYESRENALNLICLQSWTHDMPKTEILRQMETLLDPPRYRTNHDSPWPIRKPRSTRKRGLVEPTTTVCNRQMPHHQINELIEAPMWPRCWVSWERMKTRHIG